jgi:ABC-type transport system involved in multi-copper enzyme maturation permease subunit
MSTTLVPRAPSREPIVHTGVPGLRLIRSEIYKVFSTRSWWLFGLASVVISGMALWANMAQAASDLDEARTTATFSPPPGASASEVAQMQQNFAERHDLHAQLVKAAGSIFTSGQFFGLLLVLLLGTLVVTNEFQYQTATATFLTTPRRTRVIVGKLVAGVGLGMLFWLVTQVIDVIAGSVFFHNIGLTNSLGTWPIQRAILFNALGYLLWAIFGIGLGTLIRNQIGSVVTAMVVYLVGYAGSIVVFQLIRAYLIHRDGVLTAAVAMPPIASAIMISPSKLYDQSAPWWVGALVMLGWALLAGSIGILLTRRRDIS